jgi:hypothetical protein
MRQGVAEAEPWQRRYYKMKRLVGAGIIRIGKYGNQMTEREIGEGKGGYQQ